VLKNLNYVVCITIQTMPFSSGWFFDAESNRLSVVESTFSYEDIARIIKSRELKSETFETDDGAFRVWFNNDMREQFFYNESAQHVLGKIVMQWPTFHGNFLVTHSLNSNEVFTKMPDITLTQFVDSCNLAIEKRRKK